MSDHRYYRKVIQITAEDSPNVRRGLTGDDTIKEIPGVITYEQYLHRRKTWDEVRQCVGLDARFWDGADTLLYPPDWLDYSNAVARDLSGKRRDAKAMGVDSGEGSANTCWAITDTIGLIDLISEKTPDTSMIPEKTIELIKRFNIPPDRVCFDSGGGGKQHAHRLRKMGYNVMTVAFGGAVAPPVRRGSKLLDERVRQTEERYAYKNRRAQMFHTLRILMDPDGDNGGFALPERFHRLREQMAPIPLLYDGEDRIYLPSKNKKSETSKERTLIEIIGYSPDELDALACAIHAMTEKPMRYRARVS